MTQNSALHTLISDPVLILEMLCMIVTFCYIARLALISPRPAEFAGTWQISELGSRENAQAKCTIAELFNVGGMISTPKNYLRQQHFIG